MKAIIEIELEIDGEWNNSDKDRLGDLIRANPHHGAWVVEEDRLNVYANNVTVEIVDS